MKKFLAIFLCVLLSICMLASCGEDEYGKVPDNYPDPKEDDDNIIVNLYMIYDSESDKAALDTVRDRFRERTTVKYGITVELHFVSEEEYESKVLDATKLEREGDKVNVNILLVNSSEIMAELLDTNRLVDLSTYVFENADRSNKNLVKKYGSFNEISGKLIEAIRGEDGSFYAMPNNHIIGEYEYLVINEEMAKQTLKYTGEELAKIVSFDINSESYELYKNLCDEIDEYEGRTGAYVDYVTRVYGSYQLKAQLEAAGNVCNIISYPTVTADEAYSTAFAIVDSGDVANEKAMEIIYKLSTDKELRDFLQYGVKGTTYTVDEDGNIQMIDDEGKKYRLNIEYTGNVFIASFCNEIKWTKEIAQSGEMQNSEAIVAN